jgi:hypothetical protein
MMLFDEVNERIENYEQNVSAARDRLMDAARSVILGAAALGARRSSLSVIEVEGAPGQIDWLRKELRREGVSTTVQGLVLHFNVTGFRRSRRSVQPEDRW